jgi:hypothetical protein
VACPSDCSGHGKCRLAKELSSVGSYTAWEADRVQVCVCDAGYTGNDCSQRVCPFGDDPETVCTDDKRQIQTMTVDFGTLPTGVTAAGAAFTELYANDQVSLAFKTQDNRVFNTPAVKGIWNGDANAVSSLTDALTALPNFAVSDVKASASVSANKAKVTYDVTFTGSSLQYNLLNSNNFGAIAASAVAGNTVSGNQNTLMCSVGAVGDFATGCYGSGCRPKHKQPRLLDASTSSGSSFAVVNAASVLEQDASNGAADFTTPGVWGVQVTVTVTSDGTSATYKYDVSTYGQYLKSSAEMPLPPDALRSNVPISHGLYLDFNTGAIPAGSSVMTFKWRLPKCTIAVTQAADSEYDSYECSNRGTCDRKSGQCMCFNGYAGYNCGQQTIIV